MQENTSTEYIRRAAAAVPGLGHRLPGPRAGRPGFGAHRALARMGPKSSPPSRRGASHPRTGRRPPPWRDRPRGARPSRPYPRAARAAAPTGGQRAAMHPSARIAGRGGCVRVCVCVEGGWRGGSGRAGRGEHVEGGEGLVEGEVHRGAADRLRLDAQRHRQPRQHARRRRLPRRAIAPSLRPLTLRPLAPAPHSAARRSGPSLSGPSLRPVAPGLSALIRISRGRAASP